MAMIIRVRLSMIKTGLIIRYIEKQVRKMLKMSIYRVLPRKMQGIQKVLMKIKIQP